MLVLRFVARPSGPQTVCRTRQRRARARNVIQKYDRVPVHVVLRQLDADVAIAAPCLARDRPLQTTGLCGFAHPLHGLLVRPDEQRARTVLAHHPLSVALVILHIEWMTQRHYVESIKDDHELDAQFKSLLKHHWMEESQHAKLDTMMVETIAAACTPEQIATGVGDYMKIGMLIDGDIERSATVATTNGRHRGDSGRPSGNS